MLPNRGLCRTRSIFKRFQTIRTVSDHRNTAIADEVTNTKAGCGQGPFIEIPTVESLPNCSSVLVKLPSSSRFYSRLGNVSVISAEENKGVNTISMNPYNDHLYQLETKLSSGNVILSTPPTTSFQTIQLEGNNNSSWSIFNASSNIAGFSEHVQLENKETRLSTASGWGVLLLMGHNIKVVELQQGQNAMVPPQSLIAFENGKGLDFSNVEIKPEQTFFSKILANGANSHNFYKIQGPGRIVITC